MTAGLILRLPIRPKHPLLDPYPADEMNAEPISTRINSVRNDDEACIASAVQQQMF